MSFADERRAIEVRLADNFTALPVRFDNLPFDQPHDAGFVTLSIRAGQARQVSTGPRPLHRHTGTIQLDIFVPEDSGTQAGRAAACTPSITRRLIVSVTLPRRRGWTMKRAFSSTPSAAARVRTSGSVDSTLIAKSLPICLRSRCARPAVVAISLTPARASKTVASVHK